MFSPTRLAECCVQLDVGIVTVRDCLIGLPLGSLLCFRYGMGAPGLWIGLSVGLVVIGVVASVMVAISHLSMLRKLRAGEIPVPAAWPLSITICLLLSLLAVGGLWVVFRG